MRKIKEIQDLISDSEFSTKVLLFFATKSTEADFTPQEGNYVYTNLNPLTIRAYVRDISPEALVWKQYGLSNTGSKEIVTKAKYADWFKNCNKVEIDGDEYAVWKEAAGNRAIIEKRPFNTIRVILQKV